MAIISLDTFTESSDKELSLHTGEIGAVWTHHPHANYSGNNFTVIGADDRIFSDGTSAYYASGVPPSADYYAQADFHHVSTISQNIAVCVRMDTTADTMYLVRLNGGTIWEMRRIVTG